MREASGSEISGFLEEEFEDYMPSCILVKSSFRAVTCNIIYIIQGHTSTVIMMELLLQNWTELLWLKLYMVVWILHWWGQQILELCSHLSVLLSNESLAPDREAWEVTVTLFYLLNEGMHNLPTECNLCWVGKGYVEKVRNLQPEGGKGVMDQWGAPL